MEGGFEQLRGEKAMSLEPKEALRIGIVTPKEKSLKTKKLSVLDA